MLIHTTISIAGNKDLFLLPLTRLNHLV